MTAETALRVGIDLGGTKIAGVVLGAGGRPLAEHRMPAPRDDYGATVRAIGEMVHAIEQRAGSRGSIGIGIPGSVAPATGLVQNANSTWLNGKPFQRDLEAHLGRPVRLANDANCFALSEAVDGAGAGARGVFGVILGTGCGGGLVRDRALDRRPARRRRRVGAQPAALGKRRGASGPRMLVRTRRLHGDLGVRSRSRGRPCASDGRPHRRRRDRRTRGGGRCAAQATLDRHASRLARGLAHVINIFDPDVIVLGGGLSKLAHLYAVLPGLAAPYVLAEPALVVVKPPVWGDASGVRGAAWLGNGQLATSARTCWREETRSP